MAMGQKNSAQILSLVLQLRRRIYALITIEHGLQCGNFCQASLGLVM